MSNYKFSSNLGYLRQLELKYRDIVLKDMTDSVKNIYSWFSEEYIFLIQWRSFILDCVKIIYYWLHEYYLLLILLRIYILDSVRIIYSWFLEEYRYCFIFQWWFSMQIISSTDIVSIFVFISYIPNLLTITFI